MRKILNVLTPKGRLLDVLKGGAGSGNFGHSGRPGEQGGSSATSGSIKAVGRISSQTLKETKAWGSNRAKYASAAINATNAYGGGLVFKDDAGKVQGVAQLSFRTSNQRELKDVAEAEGIKTSEAYETGYVAPYEATAERSTKEFDSFFENNISVAELNFVGTAPGTHGVGRKLVTEAISRTLKESKTSMLLIEADAGAKGFWAKMGFKPLGKSSRYKHPDFGKITVQSMYMTNTDLKKAAGKFNKSDYQESGIYCYPRAKGFKKLTSVLKGGAGSGNFGHAGCEGIQGGSCGTSPAMDGSTLTRIGSKAGSIAGGIYQGTDGKKYIVKVYKNPQQAATEVAVNSLYRAAGLDAPISRVVNGVDVNGTKGFGVASEFIDDLKMGGKPALTAAKAEIARGYGVDALVANWDVVGLEHDNIGFKDGKVIRLDNGGSLTFRAQGGTKNFPGTEVAELQTLLDPTKNPNTSTLYNEAFKDKHLKLAALERAASITNDQIEAAMKTAGFAAAGMDPKLQQSIQLGLEGRRDVIASVAQSLRQKLEAQEAKGPRKAPNPKGYKFGFDFTKGQEEQVMRLNKYNTDQLRERMNKFDTHEGVNLSKFIGGDTSPGLKEKMAYHPDNWEMRKTTVNYLLRTGVLKSINDKVPLTRGVGLPYEVAMKMKPGKIFDAGDITCWTDADTVAISFARKNAGNENAASKSHKANKGTSIPVFIRSEVPAKKILNTYKTGSKAYGGFKHEHEWTIHQARRARIIKAEFKKGKDSYGGTFDYLEVHARFES